MKQIKTERRKFREWKWKIIEKIEKAGFYVKQADSWGFETLVKREKGFFKDEFRIHFDYKKIIQVTQYNKKEFVEEVEKKAKIKIIEYLE